MRQVSLDGIMWGVVPGREEGGVTCEKPRCSVHAYGPHRSLEHVWLRHQLLREGLARYSDSRHPNRLRSKRHYRYLRVSYQYRYLRASYQGRQEIWISLTSTVLGYYFFYAEGRQTRRGSFPLRHSLSMRPNSLPSGSLNCAHIPHGCSEGFSLNSTPRPLSSW